MSAICEYRDFRPLLRTLFSRRFCVSLLWPQLLLPVLHTLCSGHLEHKLFQQFHGLICHDGWQCILLLSDEVDFQGLEHFYCHSWQITTEQHVQELSSGKHQMKLFASGGNWPRVLLAAPRTKENFIWEYTGKEALPYVPERKFLWILERCFRTDIREHLTHAEQSKYEIHSFDILRMEKKFI